METTGYKLREALKIWNLRKAAAEQLFSTSLFKFEGETKEAPADIATRLFEAENAIALLQEAQMRYNLAVKVEVEGRGMMTLALAIKLAGVAERDEKLWKGVATPKKERYSYSGPELVRDPTQVRASSTIDSKDVLAQTSRASKSAGVLRAAIASGNAVKQSIENLSPALFE